MEIIRVSLLNSVAHLSLMQAGLDSLPDATGDTADNTTITADTTLVTADSF